MKKTNNEYCALTFDHVAVDKYMNQWHMEREKKGNIYNSYGEYIQFLEDRLESETDSFEIIIIKQEIKKLKKEQKKYYDIQVFVQKSKETNEFPIIGYKHHTKDSFSWTKDRTGTE